MRIDSMTKSCLVRAVLVMFLLLSISGRAIAVGDDSQQLTQILGEARDEAAELARDADEMESLIRNEVSWQTHAVMLDRVKDHVNNMARIVGKLSEPALLVLNCRSKRSTGYCLCSRNWRRIQPLRLTT
jgi:hypothetical protein